MMKRHQEVYHKSAPSTRCPGCGHRLHITTKDGMRYGVQVGHRIEDECPACGAYVGLRLMPVAS